MVGSILKNIKILVADDSPHTLILLKSSLLSLGCEQVKEATSGDEVLKVISYFKPDILICDWKMHPMDGIELAKKIRMGEDSENPFLPIIMISGYPEPEVIRYAKDAGVDAFIPKPVTKEILLEHIKTVLANPRPYVRTPSYFGPDRRDRQEFFDGEDRRKAGVQTIVPKGKRIKL